MVDEEGISSNTKVSPGARAINGEVSSTTTAKMTIYFGLYEENGQQPQPLQYGI